MEKNNVREYTDKQLIERVEGLPSFVGWVRGVYDIWVRSNEDEYNVFDDKVYTFECLYTFEKPVFVSVTTGTTNAGAYGLLHFGDYNALGCAVLKSDVLVYNSHKYGKHKGLYPAYVQNRPFPYHRDSNKNRKAEEVGAVYYNIIGANSHRAGVLSKVINNWSTACLVRNVRKDFISWMAFMDARPLATVILKEF
jgi:hypothetical protein